VPQIEVKFDIDVNGIVHVSAKDMATGNEQKVTITASTGLSKDEIDKMRQDAEAHAEQDKKQKELIDAKNEADSLAYQAEKTLKDFEGKGDAAERENIKKAAEELRNVATSENVEDIKAKSEALTKILYPYVEKMYQQQAAQGAPNAGQQEAPGSQGSQQNADPGKTDDDVVDAEYTEVDKDKQ
jgi:molecular chaperone DnaK